VDGWGAGHLQGGHAAKCFHKPKSITWELPWRHAAVGFSPFGSISATRGPSRFAEPFSGRRLTIDDRKAFFGGIRDHHA
jgi:hypothetical protein